MRIVKTIDEIKTAYLAGLKTSKPESSPFFDKAETHTLSDWLMAYSWGIGLVDPDEFHLGGLPDLSEVLDRSNSLIKLHKTLLSEWARKPLKLGKLLRKILNEGVVVDLGCGKVEKSCVPRILAEFYSADFYIGVDLMNIQEQMLANEFEIQKDFRSYFFRSDLLNFLKALDLSAQKVFLLSGIEGISPQDSSLENYRLALVEQLEIKMTKKDYLILGAGTFDLELSRKKFKLIYSDPYHEVFRRKFGFW